jgi:hypothetical protein
MSGRHIVEYPILFEYSEFAIINTIISKGLLIIGVSHMNADCVGLG